MLSLPSVLHHICTHNFLSFSFPSSLRQTVRRGLNKSCSEKKDPLSKSNYGEAPHLGTLGLASAVIRNIDAARIWNEAPWEIKDETSLNRAKTGLKNYFKTLPVFNLAIISKCELHHQWDQHRHSYLKSHSLNKTSLLSPRSIYSTNWTAGC